MYKSLWAKVLACLAVVAILSLSVLPLIVSANVSNVGDWANEAPNFSGYIQFNPLTISRDAIASITNGVNKAYEAGMFGGNIPIAITANGIDNQSAFLEVIVLISPFNASNTPDTSSKIQSRANISTKVSPRGATSAYLTFTNPNSLQGYATYRVAENGDFVPRGRGTNLNLYLSGNNTVQSGYVNILATATGKFENGFSNNGQIDIGEAGTNSVNSWYYSSYEPNGIDSAEYWFTTIQSSGTSVSFDQWAVDIETKYANNASTYSDGYYEGYQIGKDEGVLSGYQTGYEQGSREGYTQGYDEGYYSGNRNGYELGYAEGLAEGNSPIYLDIPSIFTAMFQGVHSIFSGFDINIFGISIAGMLLGCLLIVVVAFVIKKIK